jgi:hypothetical protein
MRNIKKEYRKYVVWYYLTYIMANIIFILLNYNLIGKIIDAIKENEFVIKYIYTISIIPFISILGLVIMNLLPSKWKEIIIFWRLNERLPSYYWQTKFARDDSKINTMLLNKKYGRKLSTQRQHDIWYKAYQNCKSDEAILESQKDYLFARDLCITTVLIIPTILTIFLIIKLYIEVNVLFLVANLLILISLYLILLIVTKNSANRFVCNVLSLDNANNSMETNNRKS